MSDNLIREIEAALEAYERASAAFLKPDTEIDSAAYFEVRDYLEGRAPEWLRALLDENARLRQVVEAAEAYIPHASEYRIYEAELIPEFVAFKAALQELDTPAE